MKPASVPLFDRSRLRLLPLEQRAHDLDVGCIRDLESVELEFEELAEIGSRIERARANAASVIFMCGAHVLRAGVQRYVIDMMQRGYFTCIAVNGAAVIHDYEFARIGATTESVARYIKGGQFGLWEETAAINDIVADGARQGLGLGEAIGKSISESTFIHADISIFAAAYRLRVPITVHVGIGYDIVHEHPNCDGAAYGATSYRDFLYFAEQVRGLEGGVVMNFGSSVMAPEVYLKALAMARNVAQQDGRDIRRFSTLVCDLVDLPASYRSETSRENHGYYFRPWKTMLVRTVADGGESFYVRGRHEQTVPQLWSVLNGKTKENSE